MDTKTQCTTFFIMYLENPDICKKAECTAERIKELNRIKSCNPALYGSN